MTQDDVLFGYRLQLFDLAARTSVSRACRTFGVNRRDRQSTAVGVICRRGLHRDAEPGSVQIR